MVIKILSSIHVSSALIILYISYSIATINNGSTCHPLKVLSKYIHVRSYFDGFIETNSMVYSEFNLGFWFVSYNIFLVRRKSGARCYLSSLSHRLVSVRSGKPPDLADGSRVAHAIQYPLQVCVRYIG
jgi:hypothetical protein